MPTSARTILIGIMVTASVMTLTAQKFFEPMEARSIDWRFTRRAHWASASAEQDPDLMIVQVSPDCLEKIGKWPWPRDVLANLISRIAAGSPRVIGVDIQFFENDPDHTKDQKLAKAIAQAGNVVLASDLSTETQFDSVTWELIPELKLPIAPLRQAQRAMGLVTIDPFIEDPDGVLRRTPLGKKVGKEFQSSFALVVASVFLGAKPLFDDWGHVSIGSYMVPTTPGTAIRDPSKRPILGERLNFEQYAWVNFKPPGSYFPSCNASAVLDGTVAPRTFSGKIALIGFSALGLERDQKLTPLHLMPGVEFQANVVRNLRDRDFLTRLSPEFHLWLMGILGLLLTLVFSWANLLQSVAISVIMIAGHIGASVYLFVTRGWLLDIVPIGAQVLCLLVVLKLFLLATELARKIRNLELLNRYSRHFNATLQLDDLKERVLKAFIELADADGGALAVLREDLDEVEITTRGTLPDRVANLLARKVVQHELLEFWKDAPCFVPGDELAKRPQVAPDLAEQFVGSVFIPASHFDRVRGWVFLWGPNLKKEVLQGQEPDFWLTLSSIGLTAIQNGLLYKLATVDSLTSLFVRHFFDIEIEKSFGRAIRHKEHLALLMTDIDHFKSFNDQYGHQMGDHVLRMVALELKRCVRLSDVACRYGGEEFAVILPATDVDGARLLAERIRGRISELKVVHKGQQLAVTVSVGLSCVSTSQARTAMQFIEESDEALYEAKQSGRNRVCVHQAPSAVEG
jgi:diguanylate cyclase (GGDEF)-like protein